VLYRGEGGVVEGGVVRGADGVDYFVVCRVGAPLKGVPVVRVVLRVEQNVIGGC
jgi:hypothetical protein